MVVLRGLQIAALVYGVYVMFEARPVYTVFVKDRFEIVPAGQLDPADLAEGPVEYRTLPLTGPRLLGVRFPDQSNSEEWNKLVFSGVAGKDIQNFPKYYIPYVEVKPQVLAKALPLGTLLNPRRPAPVSGGNVETSTRNADVVFRALAQAAPERVPACSGGTMSNVMLGGTRTDGTTDFSMVETFDGIMLPLIKGSLPDFAPPFEQYAADLKREAEKQAKN